MPPDTAQRRMLEALAEELRRENPGAIIEIVDEDDGSAVLDPPAPAGDPDGGDAPPDGAQ